MTRWMAGLVVGGVALALAANCSSKKDENNEDTEGGSGGTEFTDAQPDTGDTEAPPCEGIEGIDTACDFDAQEAQALQVNMLLVMDKSGSMADTPAGYPMSKWDALEAALGAALQEVQGAISFGLEFFPTTADIGNPIPYVCGDSGRCCEMPATAEMYVDVGPGTDTVPLITQAITANEPAGGTPTAAALYRALDYFQNGPGAALEGGKYVLLATDGAPNCNSEITCTVDTCTLNIENVDGCPSTGVSCCSQSREGCLDDTTTVGAITDLRAAGVTTIVVGIPGSELYAANLQDFADSGGYERTDGSDSYFEVSAEGGVEALTETFRAITTQLVTDCEVPLPDNVPNRNEVGVAVECVAVPFLGAGGASGTAEDVDHWVWNAQNPELATAIIIEGPVCDRIQSQGVERIDVVLGCPPPQIF